MTRRYYSDETLPRDSDTRKVLEQEQRQFSEQKFSSSELPDAGRKCGVSPTMPNLNLTERSCGDGDGRSMEPEIDPRQEPRNGLTREQRLLEKKKFIRYSEGAALYSMSRQTFSRLAVEAHAVYKINRLCLINTEIFEEYLETYRV